MKDFEQAAELACRQPRLVAKRALKAGLPEVDEYLLLQELYGKVVSRGYMEAANVFADELKDKGLTLACAG